MKQLKIFPDAENVNLLFVWATPDEMKLFRLEQDGLICIKEYGKINPLNSETMSCIISNLRHSFPSKETGLILWSHALGWLPNDFLSSRSFRLANGKTMSTPQLAMSLKDSFNYVPFLMLAIWPILKLWLIFSTKVSLFVSFSYHCTNRWYN